MSDRYKKWMLLSALLFFCFAFQGSRGIWEPDEGRYTAVSTEMLRSHDWLHPRLNGQPHWTKPPLTYWSIAGSVMMLGRNEFAARLPNSLALFLTTLILWHMGSVFTSRRPWLPGLVYITFLFPVVAANAITTDTLLALWEAAAVACFVDAQWGGDRKRSERMMLMMWAAFGVAFMTKGPPSLLPLAAILVFRATLPASGRAPMRWVPGLAVFTIIGFSWFASVVAGHWSLARYFVWNEVILRIFSAHHDRHSHWIDAIKIYGLVLLFGTIPWIVVLLKQLSGGIRSLAGSGRRYFSSLSSRDLFVLIWLLLPLSVFVLAKSRMYLYLLPCFAPLSILVARRLEARNFRLTPLKRNLIAAWLVLLVIMRFSASYFPMDLRRNSEQFAQQVRSLKPGPYREIAFFESRPVLGLEFYLDAAVKEVDSEDLPARLTKSSGRLWVVSASRAPQLIQTAETLGVPLLFRGTIGKSYALYEETSIPRLTAAGRWCP